MTIDIRIKVALGLVLGVGAVLGSAQAKAATPATETHYLCDESQHLVVWRDGDKATVQFIDRTYELKRKASGIGEQYLAPKAALIIDGPEAVFVADNRLQLGRCIQSRSIALAK